ncbi:hypothetical protein BK131_05700 [Paenibacillus amylolyticus]|uniref:GIY-YIG domain-containing protein n=1 Tax=Paenibacillus amylolyticus TaxID=1451 RepID=A0A1R1C5Z5_PAEAM|nr:hypothetical protein [Paenibacillus amylolyticus]OMF17457.1 hypothetical protein BK131_05700 [Paenibacillus amylolyticus]
MWIFNEDFLQNKTWNELFNLIESTEGKVIGDLKLFELVYFTDLDNGFVGNGIYIVKDEKSIRYIGKASSRPFIERLGGHLDLRKIGGFNNLLKNIVKKDFKKEESDQSIAEAGRVLMNYKLILICMEGKKDNSYQFETLENILIDKYRDENLLNRKYRLKKTYNKNGKIADTIYRRVEEVASIT